MLEDIVIYGSISDIPAYTEIHGSLCANGGVILHGPLIQVDWEQDDDTKYDFIKNKPEIPEAANNGKLYIKQDGRTLGVFGANSDEDVEINILAAGNVQADWDENDPTVPSFINNKPTIPAEQVQSDWNQTDTSKADYIKNKPTVPTQVQADWAQASSSATDFIKNKPIVEGTLSVNVSDPSNPVFTTTGLDNLKTPGLYGFKVHIVDSTLGEEATFDYTLPLRVDKIVSNGETNIIQTITGFPSIYLVIFGPQMLNCNALVRFSPSGSDPSVEWGGWTLYQLSYNWLKNKPTIPTVNNPTITLTQGSVTKGSFTLNQAGDVTIDFDEGGDALLIKDYTV